MGKHDCGITLLMELIFKENLQQMYLNFEQIKCHCVFTSSHVDDSLKEQMLRQTSIL